MDSNTFAENIKKKYPEYAGLDNATLVQKVVEKYPVYKSQITDYSEAPVQKQSSLGQRISERIQQRGNAFAEATSGTTGDGGVLGGLKGAAQAFGGVADVGEEIIKSSPLGKKILEKTQEVIGKGIQGAANKLSEVPLVRDAALSGQTGNLEKVLQGVGSTGEIAGTVAGTEQTFVGSQNLLKNITSRIEKMTPIKPISSKVSKTGNIVSDIVRDVTPTTEALRDRAVAKALRLAPVEDLATIEQATGNKIGDFLDRNDLIKNTGGETSEAIAKFQRENYDLTRDAVALVDETFTYKDIPEMKTTVDFLMNDLAKRKSPEYIEIYNRLKSLNDTGEFQLIDAQYVKNVFDDIESIYKRTGETRDAIAAQDKAASIAPVRRFIEDRVKEKYPEVDIRGINNNVQTSRAILDAIVKRAPKASTQSVFQLGDFAVVGLGNQLTPGLGFASLFGKKFIESSPIQLRLAKLWAGKTDNIGDSMTRAQFDEAKKIIAKELADAIDIGDTSAIKQIKGTQKVLNKVQIIDEKGKLTPEIKENIVNIIDDYRLNKRKNSTLQEDAAKIAEDLGIQMPKTYGALVNKLEKLLVD